MLNRMERWSVLALLTTTLLLPALPGNALTLGLDATVSGSVVSVDVVVSGLGDGVPPSVGAFDITLSYSSDVVQALGVQFGTGLGAPVQTSTSQFADPTAGTWQIVSVSFLDEAALDALQGDTVVLATLEFQVLEAGLLVLGFDSQLVTNAAAPPTALPFTSVSGTSLAVPEASSGVLLVLAAVLTRARGRTGVRT